MKLAILHITKKQIRESMKLRESSKQFQIFAFSKDIVEKIVEVHSYSEKIVQKMW